MEATRSSPPSRSDGDGRTRDLRHAGPETPPGPDRPSDAPRDSSHLAITAVHADGSAYQVDGVDGLDAAMRETGARLWVDGRDLDPDVLGRIGSILELHPLIVEDIAERNQRPKAEELGEALHLVLFALHHQGGVETSEVDMVLGSRFLLTTHDGGWDPHAAPLLRQGAERVLAKGPDYLLYGLCDALVDGYFPVFDRLTDEIDELQDDVVERPSTWTLERLFTLKREMIGVRRAVAPAREIFNQLTNRELGFIAEEHVVYFRDVYDHLIRVTDELDNYRELVAGTLEVYLSTVNNNLSNIMKRLTGVTVILAGVGAVAGIFGMSEAGNALAGGEAGGFWLVAGATVLAALMTAVVLRRIDWI